MTLVFPILLGGLALIAIPVVIHLILRQKPITLPFPAFRFLLKRHKTNLRKLRLRHLLLLMLRVLIIAAICWALARPLLTTQSLGISPQRPVAAVLLFDTSMSMQYATSEGATRLDEAKKRGVELLNELPEGSRVAILDSAETMLSTRGEWLSLPQARERVKDLKLRYDNAPVTRRLSQAYRLLAEQARARDEGNIAHWPRLVCVFSDRTRASWDSGERDSLHNSADLAPPLFEGLMQARDSLPRLAELLKDVRVKLPLPPGRDYPDQSLVEAITALKDRLPGLTRDYLPPEPTLEKMINDVRRRARDVLSHVQGRREEEEAKEYRAKLIASLQTVLRDLSGVQALWIDVGVEQPADLALLGVEFPRQPNGQPKQIFADNEIIIARAVVQASGKDFNTEITCQLGNKTYRKAVEVKAGSSQTIPFEMDAQDLRLAAGAHQLDARLATSDALAFNNLRFATFAIREPRKVLILEETDGISHELLRAIDSLKVKSGFDGKVIHLNQLPKTELRKHEAVILLGLSSLEDSQWEQLKVYVDGGGGLAVIPGANDMKSESYNNKAAQALMPGAFGKVQSQPEGAIWNFEEDSIYQHPFMQPFQHWKEFDVVKTPRSAFYFWEVTPHEKEGAVLVHYADDPKEKSAKKRPALLERRFTTSGGKVLLFTTPMTPTKNPVWNNYLEDLTSSFYLILTDFTMRYLAGETEAPNLNFIIGREPPRLAVPLTKQQQVYSLRGPDLIEQVHAGEQANLLVLKKLLPPGNYLVESASSKAERVGGFSVNAPGEECDLTRVGEADIEGVLGAGAVIPLDRKTDLKSSLAGHWSEPVELFSFLLVLLLLLLAVENLLANKFYRKES